MKSWLEKNAVEMYLTHNERKSVVAEIFIRSLALIKLGLLKAVSSGGKRTIAVDNKILNVIGLVKSTDWKLKS